MTFCQFCETPAIKKIGKHRLCSPCFEAFSAGERHQQEQSAKPVAVFIAKTTNGDDYEVFSFHAIRDDAVTAMAGRRDDKHTNPRVQKIAVIPTAEGIADALNNFNAHDQ